MVSNNTHKLGATLAGAHLLGVLLTAWYVAHLSSWAGVVWVVWGVIDFPLSLAYLLAMPGYFSWVDALDNTHPALAQLLYFPHLFHGLVGTVWWYFLPILVSKIRSGKKNKIEAQ
jgi:hypothetical protein